MHAKQRMDARFRQGVGSACQLGAVKAKQTEYLYLSKLRHSTAVHAGASMQWMLLCLKAGHGGVMWLL